MVSLLRGCCCCSLRHGVLAVAIVCLVLSLLQTLSVLSGWGWADAVRAYSYSLHRALDHLQDFYRYQYRDYSSVAETIVCAASWYSWLVVLSFFWQLRQANVAGVVYSGVQSGGNELTQPAAVGGAAPGGSSGGQGGARGGGNSDQKWV